MNFFVVSPTKEQKYQAAEIYRNNRREAELDGAYSNDQILEVLIRQGVWNNHQEDQLIKLRKAVEDLKVGLFENRLKSNAKLSIRTALNKTRDEVQRLEHIRHAQDYMTADGLAAMAKFRFLVMCSIRYENGSSYMTPQSWNLEDGLVDKVIDTLANERITESMYRELSRSEPWRSIWSSRNHTGRGLFDCASADMTDDQQSLVLWSGIYDNIREYPDCPNEVVMSDDDMLDGWMILQRRNRENKSSLQEGEKIGNEKIRKADEVFVFGEVADPEEVSKWNDPMASMVKKQRLSYVKQNGIVKEESMPDQKQRIAMEMNKLEQMKIRQGK